MRIIDNTSCGSGETCRCILRKRLVCGLYIVLLGDIILDSPALLISCSQLIQPSAVITVECSGKAFFVKNCMQTKLMVSTMENDPLALFMCQNR